MRGLEGTPDGVFHFDIGFLVLGAALLIAGVVLAKDTGESTGV